ncbi:MAG: DUF6268 family outer membrane beta-barrel protein [Bacteroidota bacterium]
MKRHIQKFCLLSIFSCLCSFAFGQKTWMGGDQQTDLARDLSFSKPGVLNKSRSKGLEITRGYSSGFSMFDRSRSNDAIGQSQVDYVTSFRAKLKIPLLNKPSFKLLLGYEYADETYHFGQITGGQSSIFQGLDGNTLKSTRYTFYATKSFTEKYYAVFRARASFNGDYDGMANFDHRYAIYSGIAAFGKKVSDSKEWGIGVSYSTGFRNTRIIPFLVYNQTFNDKWGLEAILPLQVMGRYNYSPKTLLLFGGEFTSNAYSVDLQQAPQDLASVFHIRHASIDASVTLQQQIVPWIWLQAKGGYQLPFSTAVENTLQPELDFNATRGNNFFLRVGLFLSPPDKFMK